MNILVRRSNLIVPVTDTARVRDAWRHDADAITLDLEAVDAAHKAAARGLVKPAIAGAAKGGAEVFVRVNKPFLHADLDAAVWPGLRGIMLPRVESAADVHEAADAITALERAHGVAVGSLSLILLIESARAVWDVRAIVKASARVSQVALDEVDLAADVKAEPLADLDPFEYARGRIIVEAIAHKVAPIGMAYPLSYRAVESNPAEVHALATRARNLGMKGVLCAHPSWVAPVNAAFTPTAERVAWNKRVREAFAAGVAAGTAAVPLDGRMIDVPVDEWAIVVLATAEACARRDAEKAAASARAS